MTEAEAAKKHYLTALVLVLLLLAKQRRYETRNAY
jgi:hypothetical protein